jgi:hypothetical protein
MKTYSNSHGILTAEFLQSVPALSRSWLSHSGPLALKAFSNNLHFSTFRPSGYPSFPPHMGHSGGNFF